MSLHIKFREAITMHKTYMIPMLVFAVIVLLAGYFLAFSGDNNQQQAQSEPPQTETAQQSAETIKPVQQANTSSKASESKAKSPAVKPAVVSKSKPAKKANTAKTGTVAALPEIEIVKTFRGPASKRTYSYTATQTDTIPASVYRKWSTQTWVSKVQDLQEGGQDEIVSQYMQAYKDETGKDLSTHLN